MEAERINRALARIEAAGARIETAAGELLAREPAADADLVRRHEDLRSEAGAALAELDELIGELDR